MPDYDILIDETKSMEERIEAAKRIAERYSVGEVTEEESRLIASFFVLSIDELDRLIRHKGWVTPLEEAIIRGVYEYRIEEFRERAEEMDITELARRFTETKSPVLRKIMSEFIEKRKEEVESLVISAKILEAEFLTKNIPAITSPTTFRYLSKGQIESVEKPTRSYAKSAFKNGLWNLDWGNPEEYGIDTERWISYVSRPANRDFAVMVYQRGLWREEWGDISEY